MADSMLSVLERRYIDLAGVYLERFRVDRDLAMGHQQNQEEARVRIEELDRKLIGLASELDCDTWGLR